jgi:hypothetical protein
MNGMKRRLSTPIRLPVQSAVEERLLHFLYLYSRGVEPNQVYGPLADDLKLTEEQRRARRLNSSGELAWPNLVRYARRRLVDLGLVHSEPRGLWRLTQKGREQAERRERFRAMATRDFGLASLLLSDDDDP